MTIDKNQCFASLNEACEHAGCKKPQCEHDDAAPPHVSCKK